MSVRKRRKSSYKREFETPSDEKAITNETASMWCVTDWQCVSLLLLLLLLHNINNTTPDNIQKVNEPRKSRTNNAINNKKVYRIFVRNGNVCVANKYIILYARVDEKDSIVVVVVRLETQMNNKTPVYPHFPWQIIIMTKTSQPG